MFVRSRTRPALRGVLAAAACASATLAVSLVRAHDPEEGELPSGPVEYTPDPCTDPSDCGRFGPLIPTHVTSVHAGLVWKRGATTPKLLSFFRFPEHRADDVVDPDAIHDAIDAGALRDPGNGFNGAYRPSFQQFVYGGYHIVQGLSQSVPTRIAADRHIELCLLWDLGHPDAFANAGKHDVALMRDADFAMNRSSFEEVGFSRGLYYNLYCAGHSTLSDGRVVFAGGHDMNSNNGLYKINIFDPETETWAPRTIPGARARWGADPDDPYLEALYAADPTAYLEGLDPHEPLPGVEWPLGPTVTQPRDPSDMRYARWYPTVLTLPDDRVLILAGTDQDERLRPEPAATYAAADAAFKASKIQQVVPEVYDPRTDTTVALENARMVFPLYPQAFVIQTGPGRDDWKVAVLDGEFPSQVGGQKFEGPYRGTTYVLDVQAALADPDRDVPAERHWTLLDVAAEGKGSYCGAAELIELTKGGKVASHKVAVFGARQGFETTATVEMIDFAAPTPRWEVQQPLYQPARFTHVTPLPDGTVLIANGRDPTKRPYEERNSLHVQLFDPAAGTTRKLAKTTVPRGIHGNVLLLPDATVLVVGDDRVDLVQRGDRVAPLGDPDLGVPVAQVFTPPYLLNPDGSPRPRPVITAAPEAIRYRTPFTIEVSAPADVGSVALVRTDFVTHSLAPGVSYVKLPFVRESAGAADGRGAQPGAGTLRLSVTPPAFPSQARAGSFMLFVVDRAGVPSVARHVRLTLD